MKNQFLDLLRDLRAWAKAHPLVYLVLATGLVLCLIASAR